jgi:ligand-binding SRPBCC domain-containing protein
VLERTTLIPQPIKLVWTFFNDPKNLDKMTPEFLKFEILNGGDESIFEGQVIEYRIQIIPGVKQRWLTEITHYKKHAYFVDEQRIGPYRL